MIKEELAEQTFDVWRQTTWSGRSAPDTIKEAWLAGYASGQTSFVALATKLGGMLYDIEELASDAQTLLDSNEVVEEE